MTELHSNLRLFARRKLTTAATPQCALCALRTGSAEAGAAGAAGHLQGTRALEGPGATGARRAAHLERDPDLSLHGLRARLEANAAKIKFVANITVTTATAHDCICYCDTVGRHPAEREGRHPSSRAGRAGHRHGRPVEPVVSGRRISGGLCHWGRCGYMLWAYG